MIAFSAFHIHLNPQLLQQESALRPGFGLFGGMANGGVMRIPKMGIPQNNSGKSGMFFEPEK